MIGWSVFVVPCFRRLYYIIPKARSLPCENRMQKEWVLPMSNRVVALTGAPNVGKSTVFNELTGMNRHTGNWIGKTVDIGDAEFYYKYNDYTVVDLPGAYSLDAVSKEEQVTETYLRSGVADVVVCVVDATMLERSLPFVFQVLSITPKVVLMLNLCDEAKKRDITIDTELLSVTLGVPVVSATARSGRGINALLEQVHCIATGACKPNPVVDDTLPYIRARAIAKEVVLSSSKPKQSLADKILMGKVTSVIFMLLLLGLVLWITIFASNYPSDLLKSAFDSFELWLADRLYSIGAPDIFVSLFVFGILRVLLWVVSVMLPPMAIFFPLFSVLEEIGVLPRIAFNLDYCFEKCGACGKQALTCCMGLGCNAVGVSGTRIIDSPRERLIAIITNSLTPCNGRFPLLIAIISMFFAGSSVVSALILLSFLCLSMAMTMLSSFVLSKTVLKGENSSFVMEIPPFRPGNVAKTIVTSLKDKVLFVLFRAVVIAAPAGLLIWILANARIGSESVLVIFSNALDPIGQIMGLDGVLLLAFILGFPASEIVLPIALMTYMAGGTLSDYSSLSSLREILVSNGWDISTALCTCIFSMFHFPCSTTVIGIFKETKSAKWTLVSIAFPLMIGFVLCVIINAIF